MCFYKKDFVLKCAALINPKTKDRDIKTTILVLQGPGMRLVGTEPLIGCDADTLETRLREEAEKLGVQIAFCQSNSEGDLLDFLEKRRAKAPRVLLFPTTLALNGLALRQQLRLVAATAVEVHFDAEQAKGSILAPHCLVQLTGLSGAIEGLRLLARMEAGAGEGVGTAGVARPTKTLGRRRTTAQAREETATRPRKTLGRK